MQLIKNITDKERKRNKEQQDKQKTNRKIINVCLCTMIIILNVNGLDILKGRGP